MADIIKHPESDKAWHIFRHQTPEGMVTIELDDKEAGLTVEQSYFMLVRTMRYLEEAVDPIKLENI